MNKSVIKCEVRALDRIRWRTPDSGGEIKPLVHCTGTNLLGARVINVDLLTWYAETLGIPALIYGDQFDVDLWEDCRLAFIVDSRAPRESWRQIYRQIRILLNGGIICLPVLGLFSQEQAFRQVYQCIKARHCRQILGLRNGGLSLWL
ncbi:hypothetical protein MWH71_002725 [Salmonella enterica]|nr:hypothetical protein [Salmonella enterica]EJA3654709.1 hypothetical protein [Salmonella enterica]